MRKIFTIPTGIAALLFAFAGIANAGVLAGDTSIAGKYSNIYSASSVQVPLNIEVNESEVRAGLLYDVENKKVIWQKNMQSAYPIASLTKMMVALLTMEDIRAGLFTWEDKVQWTREQYVGRGKKRRKITSTANYTLRDVFKATMIASNNECAEQMARYIGNGDLPATITRMNSRARELKMQNTFYGNPTGLPASSWMNDNASTPTDQLLLTIEMLNYEEVLEIAGMGYASIENGKASSVIKNHNKLTIDFSGEVDGLKTGYTRRAGFCLVATTAKCEHRLVGILFGCRAPQIRNEIMRDLFNDYYSAIGLDKLGPYCENPMAVKTKFSPPVSGELVTLKESVKKTHLVRSGESLSLIASKYNCTIPDIKHWNSKTVRSSRIYAGQHLTIYTKATKKVFIQKPDNGTEEEDENTIVENTSTENTKTTAVPQAQKKPATSNATKTVVPVKKPAPKDGTYIYYTVVPGDTLTSIANKYEGTTVEILKTINSITDARSLKPGMKLKVLVQS